MEMPQKSEKPKTDFHLANDKGSKKPDNVNMIFTRTDLHLLFSPTSFQGKSQEKQIYLYSSKIRSSSFCHKNNLTNVFPHILKSHSPCFLTRVKKWGLGRGQDTK